MINTDYHPNFYYVARILAERRYGSQDHWELEFDKAVEIVLLMEQLGFLNKRKFWSFDKIYGIITAIAKTVTPT